MDEKPEKSIDVLARWAGEEFVASGRAEEGDRPLHRQRAEFFADVLQELRRLDGSALLRRKNSDTTVTNQESDATDLIRPGMIQEQPR